MAKVMIRFQTGSEGRERVDGPFEYVQFVYDTVTVGKDNQILELATYDGHWWVTPQHERWADVVVYAAPSGG